MLSAKENAFSRQIQKMFSKLLFGKFCNSKYSFVENLK
jgi:hypothetical protein